MDAIRCRGFVARKLLLSVALSGALLPGFAHADESLIGIGTKLGPTTGLGFEGTVRANRYFDLRAGVNIGRLEYNDDDDGTEYRAKLKYTSYAGFVDYKPFGGGFRITGGLYSNPVKLDMHASGEDEYTFDDRDYNGDLDVAGKIRLGSSAVPYLGIGWGGTTNDSGLGASFDIGVQFAKSPDVSLQVSGRACDQQLSGANCDPNGAESFDVASNAQFQNDIEGEIRELEHDAKDFKLMPVISFGLVYRFGGTRSASTPLPTSAYAPGAARASAPVDDVAGPQPVPCATCSGMRAGTAVATGPISRPGAQTITLPRNVMLRTQPNPAAGSDKRLSAGSRVEQSDRQLNASGTWWFIQAPGLAGWVPEAELK